MSELFVGLVTPSLIVLAFALPLLSLLIKKRRVLDIYVLSATFFAMVLTIINFYNQFFVSAEPLVYKFGGWPAPLGIIYEVDRLGALFGLMVGVSMFLVACYSVLHIKLPGIEWYYTLLLGLEVGALGIVYTGDAFNLFVMLEVLGVSTYGLVAFYRTRGEAADAALKFSMLGAMTTTFYFIALVFLYAAYGTLNMADLAAKSTGGLPLAPGRPFGNIMVATAVALAFSTWTFTFKAALFPNHFWVPDVYSESPVPVSAALSGPILIADAYLVIRFLYTIFGSNESIFLPMVSTIKSVLLILGITSSLVGALFMLLQQDVKRIIAYSSIQHIGFIFMGIGLGTDFGLAAAIFHLINHSVAKVLIFLAIGILAAIAGSKYLDRLGGVGRYAPNALLALFVGILAIEGLPPLNGFMSKLMLFRAFFDVGLAPIAAIIIVSTAISLMAWTKLLFGVWLKRPEIALERVREFPVAVILVALAFACVMLGVLAPLINEAVLIPTVNSLRDVRSYIDAALRLAYGIGG